MKTVEIHLASRPKGLPTAQNFAIIEKDLPAIAEGQALVRNLWMSVDPYMRGRMTEYKSYVEPFPVGAAMEGGAVGEIVESRNRDWPVGAKVISMKGWRTHFISDGAELTKRPKAEVPDQTFLGVMGMPGMTAWVGLFMIAKLKAGETVFVSAAAGAVGSVVCQLAKLAGCTVIGSVGSDEKARAIQAMGADAAVNYRKTANLKHALAEAAPGGIDVYYENVGGEHLDAALANMKVFGRVVVCGMISQYNATALPSGPSNFIYILARRLRVEGFIVMDHWDHYGEFVGQMEKWIAQGKVKWEETVFEGIRSAPDAFLGLFEGKNKGKMLVKL
jgi:NADPH-dependent curcumin reductase CurA